MISQRKFSIPLVTKLLVPFVLGILLSPLLQGLTLLFLLLVFMVSILVCFAVLYTRYQSAYSIAIYLALACLGMTYPHVLNSYKHPKHFSKLESSHLVVEITSNPLRRGNTYMTIAEVRYCKCEEKWAKTIGKLQLIIRTRSLRAEVGDTFLIKTAFKPLRKAYTVSGYDLTEKLRSQQVYHTQYLGYYDLRFIKNRFSLSALRQAAINKIKTYLDASLNEQAAAFAKAYFLGDKSELPRQSMINFSVAGVMHILAVSGLHVGMLYLIIDKILRLILSFFYKIRYTLRRYIKIILIFLSLFAYASITNFTPSVCRASVMLFIYVLGRETGIRTSAYNAVAISMLVILLVRPMDIYSLSFQLSYLAVFAIISLYDLLASAMIQENNHKLYKYAMSLIIISICAQAGTAGLAVYHFNQFPIYFLLANLIIIPVGWLAMMCILALLILGWIPFLKLVFTHLLEYSVEVIHWSIERIAQLPASSVKFYIDAGLLIGIYTFLILLAIYLFKRKNIYIIYALASLVISTYYYGTKRYYNSRTQEIIINNNYKQPFLGFKEGPYYEILNVPTGYEDAAKVYYGKRFLTPKKLKRLFVARNIYVFNNKTVLVVDKKAVKVNPRLRFDYVICTGRYHDSASDLIKRYLKANGTLVTIERNKTVQIHTVSDCVAKERRTLTEAVIALPLCD